MNIAVQFDKNYLLYTAVMMTSLCFNNRAHIDFYVLNSALTDRDFNVLCDILKSYDVTIHDLKVDLRDFDNRLPVSDNWTIETYFVLKLPELLPTEVDRILFLDDDLIINGSLEELYNMSFNVRTEEGIDKSVDLFAAPDANGLSTLQYINAKQRFMLSALYGDDYVYFNSGVMLMNVNQLRANIGFQCYKSAMEEWNYEMNAPDQDLLNYIHGNKVEYIDWRKYNCFAREAAHNMNMDYEYVKKHMIIVHFAGSKPWYSKGILHFDIEQLWWDYAKLTPVYEQLAFDFVKTTLINPEFESKINDVFEENRKLHELLDKCTEIIERLTK